MPISSQARPAGQTRSVMLIATPNRGTWLAPGVPSKPPRGIGVAAVDVEPAIPLREPVAAGPEGPSAHPEAIKARRWRERKRLQREGCIMVDVPVTPAQVRSLRRLGLLEGDPNTRCAPPRREAVARAVRMFLGASVPLADVAAALDADLEA